MAVTYSRIGKGSLLGMIDIPAADGITISGTDTSGTANIDLSAVSGIPASMLSSNYIIPTVISIYRGIGSGSPAQGGLMGFSISKSGSTLQISAGVDTAPGAGTSITVGFRLMLINPHSIIQ